MTNKLRYLLLLLFISVSFYSCKTEKSGNEDLATVEVKEWQPEDTRSLSGVSVKRGLILNTEKGTDGYVLFEPSSSTFTFLINKEGDVVHTWESDLNSMNSYLLPTGNLVRLERDENFPTFAAGGQAGRIREYDWEGNMVWDYKYFSETELIHHDIEIMPNGNILAISYEALSTEEAIALGKDPHHIPKAGIWLDKIIEIEPVKPDGGNIVWEWHMKDHLI
ncbi:MAG: hypothetical protein HKN52_01440, partial [Eudoraea sp.]|nr:hypothetical protein [Eudoraea sp.]